MLKELLKKLDFDAESIEALTKEEISAEDFNRIFDEKYKAIEESRLAEIKKGLAPDIRKEMKDELEKGLVAEKLKAFKKELAKSVGVTESGNKIAEMSQEEFIESVKGVLAKGKEQESQELIEIKEKLRVAYEQIDTKDGELKALKEEIPVKYIEKGKYNSEKIEKAKIERASTYKDLTLPHEDFLAMADGKFARRGITLDIDENGKVVPMKDGKPLQDDRYKQITFEQLMDELYESVKPKSGGKPEGAAGGGAGGGGGEQPYISEAQKRMQGEGA